MGNRTLRKFRTLRRKVVLGIGAASVLLLLGGTAIPASAAADAGAQCANCHKEAVATFNTSFHAKIWQGANGCQSCHGSTDQHLSDQSKKTIIAFTKGGGRSAEELSQQCLNCHKKTTKLTFWDMGAHKKNDVACVACHRIHQPRPTVQQPKVCFDCHRDVRSDVNKMSHHPIGEGKVNCSDCHNPHGTLSKHMINAETNNQLCYKCHADKRGPWIWEHPPVEENCTICHTPHGSRHQSLLVERPFTLCQECHSSHGTYDNTNGFAGASPSPRVVGRECLQCHHSIHGSSNFRESFSR